MSTLSWYHYPKVYEQFLGEVAEHELTVLHSDGLYRHLRFAKPGTMMWHFDIITWPGYLTIVGDIADGYTFTRVTDMLDFFDQKQPDGNINADYWAEKLVRHGRLGVLEYSARKLVKHVNTRVEEITADMDASEAETLRQHVEADVLSDPTNEFETLQALSRFSFNGYHLDDEMDPAAWQDYNFHYLLACHALLWGIKKYRAEVDA